LLIKIQRYGTATEKKQESLAAVRARAVPVRPLAGEKIYSKSTQGTYM